MAAPPVIPNEKHTIHWFRKGLRMHDNPSLKEGLKDCLTFRCIFILDPWFAGSSNVGINKWRFLLQCLEDLDFNLRKLNSRLFVIRGQPADILPKLFKEWKTTCLSFEEDPEPFGKVRDHNIKTLCEELNIEVVSRVSHTLYDLDSIIEQNGGKTPVTYHQFQSIVAKMTYPPFAESPVTPLIVKTSTTPINEDHDDKYGVPTLEELGFDVDGLLPPTWKGGETEAMRRLERHLERKAWVASFGRPKMTPQSLLASQTGLSPYLRFGCLSTRLFYHELNKLYKRIKKAQPPLSLHGQLLWREFFYCAATRNPNFDKMVGNPICVQIPWDNNAEALAKWANAQTGFPWIDAIMTQLREEGWIHHLARHAVACFLTRGDLWVSWEEGMKIFDELLLDADWSVNAGMWMWLSCSSFFQQFFHCYCPVKFGRKADPNGDYIRRYLPILKNTPTRFIHEPWVSPLNVQKASKCVIGQDYPLPMVNHHIVSKINIERIKQVYRQLANYKGFQVNLKENKMDNANNITKIDTTSITFTKQQNNSSMYVTQNISEHEQNINRTSVDAYNTPMGYNQQDQYNITYYINKTTTKTTTIKNNLPIPPKFCNDLPPPPKTTTSNESYVLEPSNKQIIDQSMNLIESPSQIMDTQNIIDISNQIVGSQNTSSLRSIINSQEHLNENQIVNTQNHIDSNSQIRSQNVNNPRKIADSYHLQNQMQITHGPIIDNQGQLINNQSQIIDNRGQILNSQTMDTSRNICTRNNKDTIDLSQREFINTNLIQQNTNTRIDCNIYNTNNYDSNTNIIGSSRNNQSLETVKEELEEEEREQEEENSNEFEIVTNELKQNIKEEDDPAKQVDEEECMLNTPTNMMESIDEGNE